MLEALQAIRCYNIIVKNRHAVALGRLGGIKGGPLGGRARAAALSPLRRSEIARAAASARWGALPELLRPVFPGYRLEDLLLPRDTALVMLHVLSRGGTEHLRWLVRRFGDRAIRGWIIGAKGKGLTSRQMAPWVTPETVPKWQASDPYARLWEHR